MTREELEKLSFEDLGKRMLDKHKRFAAEYILDCNQSAAARRAGYSEKNAATYGSRLLKRDDVQVYRDHLVKRTFDAKGISPEYVQLQCLEVFERCMEKKPVMEWDSESHSWIASGQWQFNANGALKALDQMATLLGMKRPDSGGGGGQSIEGFLAGAGNDREF